MSRLKGFIKKVLKRLLAPVINHENAILDKLYKRVEHNSAWNRNYYQPQIYQTNLSILFSQNKVKFTPGIKIRIAFLFYIPSAWASIESVWEAVNKDNRFEPVMLLFERIINEKSDQVLGGQAFLEERGIPYEWAEEYIAKAQKPHILLYISPWEKTHLPSHLHSNNIMQKGIRVAYITYGIEYAEVPWMSQRFSNNEFNAKPWRMYAISERMIEDHKMQSPQGYDHIRAVGHPKFDGLENKDRYALPEIISSFISGRKIVFMSFHFPFDTYWPHNAIPDITEYISFLNCIDKYPDIFFLLRPHPKFFFEYERKGFTEEVSAFKDAIKHAENCALYEDGDYRNALYNASFIVGDRSALMVEAAALRVPVLYMTNFFYQEKLLPSVAPLFDSYYQGNSAYDIERFIIMVVYEGMDYKKEEREDATRLCLPYLHGSSAERILNDLAERISAED